MAERKPPPLERVYTTSWPDMRTAVETRSAPSGKPPRTIGGYAAVYGRPSQPLGGFREVVQRSFPNKTLGDGANIICRFEHNPLYILGATRSGTLRIKSDEIGLDYTVDLPESRSDVYESVDRGDVFGSSFEFQVYEHEWKHTDGYPERHLISGKLIDVGPTSNPAYLDATVSRRSAYMELAQEFDAPLDDVVRYAEQDELRRLFIRTDQRTATVAPPAPLVEPEEVPEVKPEVKGEPEEQEDKAETIVPEENADGKAESKVEEPAPDAKSEEDVARRQRVHELVDLIADGPKPESKQESKPEEPAPEVKSENKAEAKVDPTHLDVVVKEPAPEEKPEEPGPFGPLAYMEILARRPDDPIAEAS